MKASLQKRLQQERIEVGAIKTMGTPRRLALTATAVAEQQAESTAEIVGPPKAVAYDAAGKPTKAAVGFARSQGVDLADLIVVETDKGPYLAVKKHAVGLPTKDRLPEILPEWILGLSFPKSMRWGSQTIYFCPAYSLDCGNIRIVTSFPLPLGDINSGAVSYGHRFQAPKPLPLSSASAANYLEVPAAGVGVWSIPKSAGKSWIPNWSRPRSRSRGRSFPIRSWCRRIPFWWNTLT